MKNFLAVNFDGGFGVSSNADQIIANTNAGSNLLIRDFVSREQAYFYACQEYVKRELKNSPYRRIFLPRLEDLLTQPIFYTPDLVPCFVAPRLFAAFSQNFVAILDNIPSLCGFIQQIENFEIREVYSTLEAQRFIEGKFYKTILPFGAYIDSPIPRCPQIPLNMMVQVPFVEWFQKNVVENLKIGENFPKNISLLNSSN